jgi:hypothetical protein
MSKKIVIQPAAMAALLDLHKRVFDDRQSPFELKRVGGNYIMSTLSYGHLHIQQSQKGGYVAVEGSEEMKDLLIMLLELACEGEGYEVMVNA